MISAPLRLTDLNEQRYAFSGTLAEDFLYILGLEDIIRVARASRFAVRRVGHRPFSLVVAKLVRIDR